MSGLSCVRRPLQEQRGHSHNLVPRALSCPWKEQERNLGTMLTFTVLGGYCNLRFEHVLVLGPIVFWDCFRSYISFAGFDWLLLLLRFRLRNWVKIHLPNSSEPVRSEGKLPLISPPVISPLGYKLPSYKSPSVISPPNPPSYKPLQLKAPPPQL